MNIGLFGDSYVDISRPGVDTWGHQLNQAFDQSITTTGAGGSNQYWAIKCWNDAIDAGQQFDYAIFTFTWHHRLYHDFKHIHYALRASAEARLDQETIVDGDKLRLAIQLYRDYLHDNESMFFNLELMIKHCLELPDKHPDTKFIFLPNTEIARNMASKHFTHGVLLDFAFETISNNEEGSPGPVGEVWDSRPGHMSSANHTVFKDIIKDVIINYNQYHDQIYPVDYGKFNLKTYPTSLTT